MRIIRDMIERHSIEMIWKDIYFYDTFNNQQTMCLYTFYWISIFLFVCISLTEILLLKNLNFVSITIYILFYINSIIPFMLHIR